MSFLEQAAAIPRVWSSATFPTILCLFLPLPLPLLSATSVATESTGVAVKILLRIVCRPDPPLDVTTGKNRKPPGNWRKNSSGSNLFSPPVFCIPSPSPRAPFGSAILSTMILLASFVSKDFEARFKILLTPKVSRMSHPFSSFKHHSTELIF